MYYVRVPFCLFSLSRLYETVTTGYVVSLPAYETVAKLDFRAQIGTARFALDTHARPGRSDDDASGERSPSRNRRDVRWVERQRRKSFFSLSFRTLITPCRFSYGRRRRRRRARFLLRCRRRENSIPISVL